MACPVTNVCHNTFRGTLQLTYQVKLVKSSTVVHSVDDLEDILFISDIQPKNKRFTSRLAELKEELLKECDVLKVKDEDLKKEYRVKIVEKGRKRKADENAGMRRSKRKGVGKKPDMQEEWHEELGQEDEDMEMSKKKMRCVGKNQKMKEEGKQEEGKEDMKMRTIKKGGVGKIKEILKEEVEKKDEDEDGMRGSKKRIVEKKIMGEQEETNEEEVKDDEGGNQSKHAGKSYSKYKGRNDESEVNVECDHKDREDTDRKMSESHGKECYEVEKGRTSGCIYLFTYLLFY